MSPSSAATAAGCARLAHIGSAGSPTLSAHIRLRLSVLLNQGQRWLAPHRNRTVALEATMTKTKDRSGPPLVQLRVQTPRGMWSMTHPEAATRRPEYPISGKVQEVIDDAR